MSCTLICSLSCRPPMWKALLKTSSTYLFTSTFYWSGFLCSKLETTSIPPNNSCSFIWMSPNVTPKWQSDLTNQQNVFNRKLTWLTSSAFSAENSSSQVQKSASVFSVVPGIQEYTDLFKTTQSHTHTLTHLHNYTHILKTCDAR